MTTNIYVLKLQNGFYYVGKSDDVKKRFNEHLTGNGSSITKKYKPLFDEDKFVKMYMDKYGINKVRGGTYVNENLDDMQIINLKREIWGAKNLCTKCGRNSHWIKDCYATTDICGDDILDEVIIYYCDKCDKQFNVKAECEKHEKYCKVKKDCCFRCGRTGHYATDCFAKTDTNGYELSSDDEVFICEKCDKEFDDLKNCEKHERYCKGKNNKCYNCGKSGHFANNCYYR